MLIWIALVSAMARPPLIALGLVKDMPLKIVLASVVV
jgi:hypothetical protein